MFLIGVTLKEGMLMKTPQPVGLTLAGLILLSTVGGLMSGIEPARADDNWFEPVRENCERVKNGYFCRDSKLERSYPGQDGRGPFESSGPRTDNVYGRPNSNFEIREGRLYRGAVIETSTFDNDRFEVRRGDSRSLTLLVDRDIRSDTDNYTLIPKGSRIFGKLRPNDGGVRFEADYITLSNGKNYDLDAQSETIYPRNNGSSDRISSSAATVILSTILGRGRSDSNVGDIIRGGDIFSSSRDRGKDDYISINPKSDLDLQLTDDFRVRN
jgi:hypothetical protein